MASRRTKNRDGRFVLEYQDGYAVLMVHPPAGSGKPVYIEDVTGRMNLLGVPAVSRARLAQIIAEAGGHPERLVAWPAGAELSASLDIVVSKDRLSVTAVMHEPKKGGSMLTGQAILDALHGRGIRFGIMREPIDEMVEGNRFEREIVVARGQAPTHGKPQRIRYTFDPVVGKPYLMGEFGRINLRELNFVHEKHTGDVLAELLPQEPAEDGRDVFGQTIPAAPPGEGAVLLAGENTAMNEQNTAVLASIDGNAYVRGSTIHMEPVISVDNVDYETGNIRFEGTVVVRNEIADGFTVEAGGTLEVGTRVGRVTLKAGRQLVLKGGANCNNEGSFECGGDVFARYLENARISCDGDLIVEEAIMHSEVSAKGNLVLSGRRAEIFGGRAVVGGSLWCRQLGSVAEVQTRISLGIDPGILEAMARTRAELQRRELELEELQKKIRYLESHRSADEDTAEKASKALGQLKTAADGLEIEVRELIHLSREQRSQLTVAPTRIVVAEERMYHGVTIAFGALEFAVPTKGRQATILRMLDGKVVEHGYSPADPPTLLPAGGQADPD
jgi:uncharacterized protein (DUF342 family)